MKYISKNFITFFSLLSISGFARDAMTEKYDFKSKTSLHDSKKLPFLYSVDLDPLIQVNQKINEKGLVIINGKLTKPFTTDNIKLVIKYQDAQGNWVSIWCKNLYSYNQYNEILKASFELPASSTSTSYNLKIVLESNTAITPQDVVAWQKSVSHYKQGDYAPANCDLDENEFTFLVTPKKSETVITNAANQVVGIKDRVTSAYSWDKLSNVLLDNKKADVALSLKNPTALLTDVNGAKSIKMLNTGAVADTLASTGKFIYNAGAGHPIPYLHSYDDPVYMIAGKFSVNGIFIKFSEYPGDPNGPGYHDFRNPANLISRYFNLYNSIHKNLSDFITDQEPVVLVSSIATGFRVYKSNGTYINLTPDTTSNYGGPYFGYTNDQANARRGPGSENLILSNTPEMTLYGAGYLRNDIRTNYQSIRSMSDLETEINKFIKYTGIFPNTTAYDPTECANSCFTINTGAIPDNTPADWTKAPNSYIFTGKDKNGNDVDGLYIPVKKAYAMWRGGGEFMRDENGNFTPIPAGTSSAGLYWEDTTGLIRSVSLEGTGEDAKIKVLVNKTLKGNASISFRVGANGNSTDPIYWTWHVWVTDDPTTNGSTYHHGFEKDKNGNVISDWKWMDRNLGATSAEFVGNNWHKSAGLQYQWGRKDPFPPFANKDLGTYGINGEINLKMSDADFKSKFIRIRGNKLPNQPNTGTDTPNGNIRYSIKNPISYIIPPVYVAPLGQTLANDGENYLHEVATNVWAVANITTWFSKQKYKKYTSPYREDIVAWDLWGDTRQGKYSDIDDTNTVVAEESKRYALKSPYDPCPCQWRVPSFYFSGGRNSNTPLSNENRYNPWGKHTGSTTDGSFKPDVLNASYAGIKIYPQFGFDFSGVTDTNIGKIPVNGNYEYYPNYTGPTKMGTGWVIPEINYQDQSADGGLTTSTVVTATEVLKNGKRETSFGVMGLGYNSDPLNKGSESTTVGLHTFGATTYSQDGGVRCIQDPNNAYMPQEFTTQFVPAVVEQYSLDVLKSWTKLPNSYVEYTDPTLVTPNPNGSSTDPNKDNDRIIEIPLKKAYAMHKLYLSTDFSFPVDGVKSASVVWTSNTALIQKMEILNASNIETAVLKVTLNQGSSTNPVTGNAVVAFHMGTGTWTNGKHNDPVLWSWHIWVPKTVISTYSVDPENTANGGILAANQQFVNPVKSGYGIPMKTTFMDRDLGARLALLNEHINEPSTTIWVSALASVDNRNPAAINRLAQIRESGGLHFQWGRKDPMPVFYNPGYYYNYSVNGVRVYNNYPVFRQNNPANVTTGAIAYGSVNETDYLNNSLSYAQYSSNANILPADTKATKLKKILKYSVNNPYQFLYQTDATKSDWLSDENGNMPERWGHASEKSPYDPCPVGWRIVDLESVSTGVVLGNFISKGNTPWFYNAKFNNAYGMDPGNIGAVVKNENYDISKPNYIGDIIYTYQTGYGAFTYGFLLDKPEYNIGLFPNNGIRGFDGGNTIDASKISASGGQPSFKLSGIWTAASQGAGGSSLGMLFKSEINRSTTGGGLYFLTPTFGFRPQAAMSCRCAKDEPRYSGIPVTSNTGKQAISTLSKIDVEEKVKNNKFVVFPNPVRDQLFIDAQDGKDYYFQIYNMSGQKVKEGKFSDKQTNVSSLPKGVYLIRINDSGEVVKIIKE